MLLSNTVTPLTANALLLRPYVFNGHTHKGVVSTAGAWRVDDDPVHQFKLCTNFKFDNRVILKPITLSDDHMARRPTRRNNLSNSTYRAAGLFGSILVYFSFVV